MSTLKQWRMLRGLSQAEAAKVLEVSRIYISLIERGLRNPSAKLTAKIAADIGETIYEQNANQVRTAAALQEQPIAYETALRADPCFIQLTERLAAATALRDNLTSENAALRAANHELLAILQNLTAGSALCDDRLPPPVAHRRSSK